MVIYTGKECKSELQVETNRYYSPSHYNEVKHAYIVLICLFLLFTSYGLFF